MRRIWQHLHSAGVGTAILIGVSASVTVLVLVSVLWWQHDDRPWPLLVWAGIKGLLWSKTVFKIAIAAGLGVTVAVRALARRVRRPAEDGADQPAAPTSGAGVQVVLHDGQEAPDGLRVVAGNRKPAG